MSLKPRIAFAGTPDFAVPALSAVLATGAEVPLVLTQPDRRAGRGRKLAASPVKSAAEAHGLRVLQPTALSKSAPAEASSEAWGEPPDLMVVVAYGLLLPRWLLEWPRLGAINIHASLLPRWRGAAPIQHAILAGDTETGISIMKMDAGLDTGPVYARKTLAIGPAETGGTLHDRLARLGADLLSATLPGVLGEELSPEPQDAAAATYAPKIHKSDAVADWAQTAMELERRVRAFNPWPVCETSTADGKRVRIWEAEVVSGTPNAPAGSVVSAGREGIDVATGEGVLRILRLQAPSGKAMSAADYLNAHSLLGCSFVS